MARSTDTKRHVSQDGGLPHRETHAGCDRRGSRRDSVGERPPAPRAVERRGRGRPDIPCSSRPSASSRNTLPGSGKSSRLKLDLVGTAFQRKVWNALRTIPFGETRSYGQIATQIGIPLPCALWAPQTAGIPSRSWRRAIGSSDPWASSRDSPAALTSRRICWRWSASVLHLRSSLMLGP